MKNKFSGLLILFSSFLFAQEIEELVKKETKFQVGLHYVGNLRNENIVSNGFNGVVGISGNYTFYKNETIAVSAGLNIDYLQSRGYFYPNDILIWNPNLSIEVDAFKGRLKPFLGIGYGFFSNKFMYNDLVLFNPSDPAFGPRERKVNFNGITINPGLKYHISYLIYLEASYKYYPVNSKDFDGTANVHLINFGLGFKF
jgi:opacity protein-like surface antigen